MTELRVGRREVAISHPDRVVFPRAGLTKLDLARHYERVGEAMAPLVAGRPLALEAFPSGIDSEGALADDAATLAPARSPRRW